MKFTEFFQIQDIPEDSEENFLDLFRAAVVKYLEESGSTTNTDIKADFVIRAADSVASLEDPFNKIKKASRELSYNPVAMSLIKRQIMENLGLAKTNRSFELLWDSFKKSLNNLSEKNTQDYEILMSELSKEKGDRLVEIKTSGRKYNLLKEVKSLLGLSSDADEFLEDLYNLKVQIGKNPSGKGEYFLDFLIRNACKGSDVKIGETEYELKSTSGAIGEPLGSRAQFQDQIRAIFKDAGEEILEKMSFGKKDFWNWADFFTQFTMKEENKEQARNFLRYHCAFNIREVNQTFSEAIENFVNNPTVSSLLNFYDLLSQHVLKTSLREGFKSMIVFEEKSKMNQNYWTGEVYVFKYEDIENVIVFAGNRDYEGKVRVGFSKGNNTGSRPDIAGI